MDRSKKFKTVEEYFSFFPASTQKLLQDLRSTIRRAAPQAEEVISYNMPAFKLNRILVYYAGHTKHIGFYPTSSPIKVFAKDLADYTTSKGAIQFALDQPIPKILVKNIVKFRVKENLEKAKLKAKK